MSWCLSDYLSKQNDQVTYCLFFKLKLLNAEQGSV